MDLALVMSSPGILLSLASGCGDFPLNKVLYGILSRVSTTFKIMGGILFMWIGRPFVAFRSLSLKGFLVSLIISDLSCVMMPIFVSRRICVWERSLWLRSTLVCFSFHPPKEFSLRRLPQIPILLVGIFNFLAI